MSRILLAVLVATGCRSAPAAAPTTARPTPTPIAPAPLASPISAAELDARLADHRLRAVDAERLEDAPDRPMGAMTGQVPAVRVEGDVISALACRPGGTMPALVADDHFVYVTFADTKLSMHGGPGGEALATPSTYCSFQRFRMPAGMRFGGTLRTH
jgi:hypothetical protein